MISVAKKLIRRDPPSKWTTEMVAAPPFDVETYQEKLNRIAGYTQQGEPVLRLTWGGDATWFNGEEETPRHAMLSKKAATFGKKIPIRRWIIEQNTDAGQIAAMGGKDRHLQTREKGFYTAYIYVGDHSQCPPDCCEHGGVCLGDYKAPNHDELSLIIEHTYQLLADKRMPDPRNMVIPEMAEAFMPKPLDEKEQEEKDDEENVSYIKDWIRTHGVGRVSNVKPS